LLEDSGFYCVDTCLRNFCPTSGACYFSFVLDRLATRAFAISVDVAQQRHVEQLPQIITADQGTGLRPAPAVSGSKNRHPGQRFSENTAAHP